MPRGSGSGAGIEDGCDAEEGEEGNMGREERRETACSEAERWMEGKEA